jgi:hypothetical protein
VSIGAGSFVVYGLVYLALGRSYQQWKLASYVPLPLSFICFAAAVRLAALAARRPPGIVLPCVLAIVFVGGNARAHASGDPPLRRFPASFGELARIDQQKSFRELYVEMDSFASTFMPLYFVRHKVLHLVSGSYYPSETLSLDRVSRSWPYFTQKFDCGAVGHSNTMSTAVGCLLFEPPGPDLDASYPFNRPFMFVTPVGGFGSPESWGRPAEGRAQFDVEADAQRVPLDGTLYVNLLMRPNVASKDEEWVSVRLEKEDWKGARVRTATVRLDVPNQAGFVDLILSRNPRGRLVSPAGDRNQ